MRERLIHCPGQQAGGTRLRKLSKKKLTSAVVAEALSASLLAASAAHAAEDRSSSSSTVTGNRDNAGAIPDGYEAPDQGSLAGVYTGFAPLSLFLSAAAVAGILGTIAQLPLCGLSWIHSANSYLSSPRVAPTERICYGCGCCGCSDLSEAVAEELQLMIR